MSQESSVNPSENTPAAPAKSGSTPGKYIMQHADIPAETAKLMVDKMGEGSQVHPPRENGVYRGRVIFTSKDYIGQAVGKDEKKAVLHRREDVELMGHTLNDRLQKGMLNKAGMNVIYKGDKAKAYPIALEKQQDASAAPRTKPAPGLSPDEYLAKATEFAATIKNPKQREAFLKNVGAVTEIVKAGPDQATTSAAASKQQRAEPAKAAKSSPAKAVEAERGIER